MQMEVLQGRKRPLVYDNADLDDPLHLKVHIRVPPVLVVLIINHKAS